MPRLTPARRRLSRQFAERLEERRLMAIPGTADFGSARDVAAIASKPATVATTASHASAQVDLVGSTAAARLLTAKIYASTGTTEAEARRILDAQPRRADAAAGLALDETPYWSSLSRKAADRITPTLQAVRFEALSLNVDSLSRSIAAAPHERDHLSREALPVLMLPTPTGGVARFGMEAYDLLAPSTAALFPEIRSVRIFGLDDPTAIGHATMTSAGLTAYVSSPDGDWSIKPLDNRQANATAYASYFETWQAIGDDAMSQLLDFCQDDDHDGHEAHGPALLSSGPEGVDSLITQTGPTRRNFRLAVAATGEFTGQFVSQALAFSYITAFMATGNTIFNRDFNVNFTIVSNLTTVFTNAATDGYTNNAPNLVTLNDENKPILNAAYTEAAYDLGIVLAQGGYAGLASGLGVDIGGFYKATTSMRGTATTLLFERGVYHEIAHKMGAGHTFNTAGVPDLSASYETGAGSTIMAYGGLGWPGNYVTVDDPYFHHRSIDQVEEGLTGTPEAVAAAVTTATGNLAPEVNAGPDRAIPANTPFELTGKAYDLQGSALTYTWEQYDLGTGQAMGTDDGTNPLFRSREGTKDPTRMFPELDDVLANRVDGDEFLPTVNRTANPLTFRLTVRDQLGGVGDDVIDLPVVNTGSAFAITSQNLAGTTWNAGSLQTVSWNVAGTTANGINAANVDIFISYDAGVTFTPVVLNTANNGSRQFTVPVNAPNSTTARVKVKASDNYFFDINNAPITINGTSDLNGLPVLAPAVEATIYPGPGNDLIDADFPIQGGLNPNINTVGDTDTYLFSPGVTDVFDIRAASGDGVSPSSVDTVLSVYDNFTGARIAINDDESGTSLDSRVTVTLEAGKLYRISVGDYASNDTGEVTLTITGGATMPVSNLTLNASGVGSGSGTLVSGRESKFHGFTVPTFYSGTGTLTYAAPSSALVASLYDSTNTLRAFSTNGSFSGPQLAALTPGATYYLRIGAQQYATGGGNYTVNVSLNVATLAAGKPDLNSLDDVGQFGNDNVTMTNAGLRFSVQAAGANQYIRLFRDGVLVAGPTQVINAFNNTAVNMVDAGPIPDGTHVYTATSSLTSTGAQSAAGPSLSVTVDTVVPSWTNSSFYIDNAPPTDHGYGFLFSEPVYGFQRGTPVFTNTTTNAIIPFTDFYATGSGADYDVFYNPTAGNDRLPDGRYAISIPGESLWDIAGNAYIQEAPDSVFFLNGDANRDARVNFDDLLILAANYNQSGRRFTQGDFTYDGVVNFDDLLILAAKYNYALPGSLAPAPVLAGPGPDDDARDDGSSGAADVLA